ncbi:MAG: radical SAM protein [Holophagaceae bacterium]
MPLKAFLPRLDPRKRIASLFLLPDCNMACDFCGSEGGFDTMSRTQAEGALADLAAQGVRNLVLGGGEPLLWPHGLGDLARLAKGMGCTVQLCTNAIHLPEALDGLDAVDRFILPLEAADPAVHDRLRHHPGGHHALVWRRLEALRAAGREVTLSTVVTRENLDGLGDLAVALRALGARGARIHAWHLYRFLPIGRSGARHADRLATDTEAYRAAVEAARREDLGFPVYRRSDMVHASSVAYVWAEGGRLKVG